MSDENQNPSTGSGESPEEPVIRDKRRIDPETGEVRQPMGKFPEPVEGSEPVEGREPVEWNGAAEAASTGSATEDEDQLTVDDILNAAQAEVQEPSDEHLADLKRVTAEYANYRKRTEANREVERERAIGAAVAVLLPVLDDLDRAEKHGDLEGDAPFATIAAKLRASVEKLGLTAFGDVGEPFDPQKHEAIFQQPSDEVETDTVADVVETGYWLGGTLLRAAKVVVKTPQA
ncbi:MAG: nucleotide exchange factor GrpE [Actinomycetota bacterium]|nr:nucleotide exchange factor GrpE [Actinomycetota bacterium]